MRDKCAYGTVLVCILVGCIGGPAQKALRLTPDEVELRSRGDYAGAANELDVAIKLDPTNAARYVLRATVRQPRGRGVGGDVR